MVLGEVAVELLVDDTLCYFMMTGTREVGQKFEGLEGFPDWKMEWTVECFQGRWMSGCVKQVLVICRRTPPIAGNLVFSMRMRTPSAPQAGEVRMLKIACPSSSRDIHPSWKLHTPTQLL